MQRRSRGEKGAMTPDKTSFSLRAFAEIRRSGRAPKAVVNNFMSLFSEDHALAHSATITQVKKEGTMGNAEMLREWCTGKNVVVWNSFQIVLGIASYSLIVWSLQTTLWGQHQDSAAFSKVSLTANIFGAFMLLDYVALLYWHRFWTVPLPFAIIDFSIIVASMATSGRIFAIFCELRIIRILRTRELVLSIAASKHNGYSGHQTHRQRQKLAAIFIFLGSLLIVVLLIAAAFFPIVEPSNFSTWADGLYFAVVTISTVGYGDLSADTNFGRVSSMLLILITFLFVPLLLGRMLQTYNDLTRSMVGKIIRLPRRRHFVIVTGRFGLQEIKSFVEEMYAPDNKSAVFALMGAFPDIDFIQDIPPTKDIQEFISQPLFQNRLSYQVADPSKISDLATIEADKAIGFFVLSNRTSDDDNIGDQRAVVYALALSHYCPMTRLQVEVHSERYKDLARALGIQNCVCLESLRGIVLGNGLRYPSLTPFTMNLLKSGLAEAIAGEGRSWESEYSFGMSNEVYQVALDKFVGKTFSQATSQLFLEHMVTLFAVRTVSSLGWLLFPGKFYTIEPGDLGFVLASNYDTLVEATKVDEAQAAAQGFQHRSSRYGRSFTTLEGVGSQSRRKTTMRASQNVGGELYCSFRVVENPAVLNRMITHCRNRLGSAIDNKFLPQFLSIEHTKSCKAFHLTEKPRLLDEALLSADAVVDFEDHVLICGSMYGMAHTVSQLRRELLKQFRVVVFVLGEQPTQEMWAPLSYFTEIYIVVGDLSTPDVFVRANVEASHAVLVTTTPQSTAGNTDSISTWTMDATAVMITLVLENLLSHAAGKPHILTEVSTDDNMQLLMFVHQDTRGKMQDEFASSVRASPGFAAGRSFTVEQLRGNMIVQMFLKPNFLSLIHLLLFGQSLELEVVDETIAEEESEPTQLNLQAPDKAATPRIAWASSAASPPHSPRSAVIERELYLHQEPVSRRFHGAPYARYFEECVANDKVCLGLYRPARTAGSTLPYTLTNPPPDLMLVPDCAWF